MEHLTGSWRDDSRVLLKAEHSGSMKDQSRARQRVAKMGHSMEQLMGCLMGPDLARLMGSVKEDQLEVQRARRKAHQRVHQRARRKAHRRVVQMVVLRV